MFEAARPVGVMFTVAGGAERGSRPTPPGRASLTIGCTRNISSGTPLLPTRQTRP